VREQTRLGIRASAVLLATALLATPAVAQTPERESPFAPRSAPATDQYTTPSATTSGGSGGTGAGESGRAAPASGGAGSRLTAPNAGRDRGGVDSEASDPQAAGSAPLAVRGEATPSEPGSIAGDDLPFTGGPVGALLLVALALLTAGLALRLYGARRKPAGRRMRGLR
jgi:hypothetical protein